MTDTPMDFGIPMRFRTNPIRWFLCRVVKHHSDITIWGGKVYCAHCGDYIESLRSLEGEAWD
jgi:hypothetical protein